jgi:hypothetical protein
MDYILEQGSGGEQALADLINYGITSNLTFMDDDNQSKSENNAAKPYA